MVRRESRSQPRFLEFDGINVEEVVATMEAMAATGRGWINFQPAVEVDELPAPDSAFFGIFSGRGPNVPLATWTPASPPGRRRPEPQMVGLQHPAGTKAKTRLIEAGHPVPEGWAITQDSPRRGLVVVVPASAPHMEIVRWLIRAAGALSPVPFTGTWRAAIYGE